ncbi:hypothetical protein ACLRDC_10785 [Gluconacetobacter sacchari]|uniref:hypothetical protein n=1 Tax=Gluconacetobacter sacchari TaxID=92759 RepID=UPI0039B413D5
MRRWIIEGDIQSEIAGGQTTDGGGEGVGILHRVGDVLDQRPLLLEQKLLLLQHLEGGADAEEFLLLDGAECGFTE